MLICPRLTDKDIKRLHQIYAFRTFDLLHGVNTVRQIVDFSIAPLISNEIATLCFLSVLIRTCELQVNLEFSTDFFGFNLSITIVFVLDKVEATIYNFFIYVKLFRILLDGILTRFYVKPVNRLIKKISFGRSNLTDVPSFAAYIVIGKNVTVLISGIGVYEFIVAIYTVHCTCQRRIPLRLTVRETKSLYALIRVNGSFQGHDRDGL